MPSPVTTAASNLNAVMFPLLGNTDGQGSTIESCILQLAVDLANAKSVGLTGSRTSQFVTDLLVSPIKEIGSALNDLFLVDQATNTDCVQASDGNYYSRKNGQPCSPLAEALGSYASAVRTAMENPFDALFSAQLNVLSIAGDQAIAVIAGTGDPNNNNALQREGVARQVANRVELLIRQLVLNAKAAPQQLGGLLFFALQEGLPAIEAELLYLGMMKRLVQDLVSEASALPPSMIPGFPNASATDLLCQAELHLRAVRNELNAQKTFNRSEMTQASDKTCQARDVIASGTMAETFARQLKNLYGLTDLQFNTLKNMKFMPDPMYRIRTLQLIKYNALLQDADATVITFYKNLQKFLVNLDGLTGIHIADILAMIIEILRREVATVRAALEADASGFDLQADALGVANPDPKTLARTTRSDALSRNKQARQAAEGRADVFSYASTQAAAYVSLTVLCTLMQKTQSLYDKIQLVLSANDKVIDLIKRFTADLQSGSCGPTDGADRINDAVKSFLSSTENRLDGIARDNRALTSNGELLIQRIEEQERFVTCFKEKALALHLNLGIDPAIIAAAMNIYALVKRFPELKKAISSLGKSLFGGGSKGSTAPLTGKVSSIVPKEAGTQTKMGFTPSSGGDEMGAIWFEPDEEYPIVGVGADVTQGQYVTAGAGTKDLNVIDALMRSIQCLILQCDNAFLSSTARQAMATLDGLRLDVDASNLSIGRLDSGIARAAQTGNNRRLQAFLRIIQAIQRLTSINISQLCNIKPYSMSATTAGSTNTDQKAAEMASAVLSGNEKSRKGTLDSDTAQPVDQAAANKKARAGQASALGAAAPFAAGMPI